MTVVVFANEKHFSKHWKNGLEIFQGLEKMSGKVPSIGKTASKFSKHWKRDGGVASTFSNPWKKSASICAICG